VNQEATNFMTAIPKLAASAARIAVLDWGSSDTD
jgi:hypothetical protein